MQFNPEQKTLESELEAALVKAGGISAENAGAPSKAGTLSTHAAQQPTGSFLRASLCFQVS